MATRVRAEWDRLRRLAVHRPGMEMWLGLLAPRASLYERAFSRYEARREHERLEYALTHEFKVEVVRLKEKLLELADRKPEVREKLIALALRDLKYAGNP
ncbi:MAG: amidinotransferase, partial [Thaumarchaeota archaeon]